MQQLTMFLLCLFMAAWGLIEVLAAHEQRKAKKRPKWYPKAHNKTSI